MTLKEKFYSLLYIAGSFIIVVNIIIFSNKPETNVEKETEVLEIPKEIDNSELPVTRIIDIKPETKVLRDYDLINISIDLNLSKRESTEEITRQVFNMLKFLNSSPFIRDVGRLEIKGYNNDEKTETGWIYNSN